MREIVLDTESTGLDPYAGHRLVEIGCIEIENLVPTGRSFWTYLNPEREIPAEATNIHGITNEFVLDKPLFAQKVDEFLEFIGDAPLVIHNATFDMKFINYELQQIGYSPIPFERAVDTLPMARRKFPGSPANLDALCRRFEIDNSNRTYHGALLDAELLALVYMELKGGRQPGLAMEVNTSATEVTTIVRSYRAPRDLPGCTVNETEVTTHSAFITKLKNPLWAAYLDEEAAEAS